MFFRLTKIILAVLTFALVQGVSLAAKPVAEYPLFTCIEGFKFESDSKELQFESRKFRTGSSAEELALVEGKFFDLRYRLGKGLDKPGGAYVIRNLVAATEKAGGKVLYQSKYTATLNIQQGTKDIWVDASSAGNGSWYYLRIIERGELKQEVKVNPVLDAIDKTGKATVYINFDTASSQIKPNSASVIDDIFAMLRQRPELKVSVEGHTDGDGNAASNLKLSEDRAAAVVDALIKDGVSNTRLSSKGFGMSKPIADNKTDEGKARNRRVELVRLKN